MYKTLACLVLVAAFCFYANGATVGDAQGAISVAGAEVRVELLRRVRTEVAGSNLANLTPEQANCLHVSLGRAAAEVNRVLVQEQVALRREALTRSPAVLAGLTREQLRQEARDRLQAVLEPTLADQEAIIRGCVL